eukprot:6146656-Prymnesium_polylepis.1
MLGHFAHRRLRPCLTRLSHSRSERRHESRDVDIEKACESGALALNILEHVIVQQKVVEPPIDAAQLPSQYALHVAHLAHARRKVVVLSDSAQR